jgi:type I restriction enzyme S subunit
MTENGWNNYRLSDIVILVGGGTPKTTSPEYWNGNIPWLSVADINCGYRYVSSSEKTITPKAIEESSTTLLKKGQLIISARGTVGTIAQLCCDMAFNQSCYGITAKENLTSNDFLYYLLNYVVRQLKQKSHGGVFDTITRDTFDQISVDLPPLPIQHAISRILGSLDDKIELNRQMNVILEAMVRAIFKSWFVDFDPVQMNVEGRQSLGNAETAALFPECFEDSEIGEIPTGWKIERFQKILRHSTERIGSEPAVEYSATVTGLTLRDERFNKQLSKTREKNKKIVKGDLVFGLSRKIINFGLMKENIGSVSPVYEIFKVSPDIYVPELLEMQIRYNMSNYIDILKPSAREGQCIDREYLLSKFVLIPDMLVQKKYYQIYSILQQKIENNDQQTSTLTQIRDALLPKLMSGEIRVDNVTS